MPKNPASALVARRRQRVDRTLEAVEDVGRSAQRYLKGLVVVVTTNFTGFHCMLLVGSLKCGLRKRREGVEEPQVWTAAPRTLRIIPVYTSVWLRKGPSRCIL